MSYKIVNKYLDHIAGDYVIDEVNGIVLHADPSLFNKSINEVYEYFQSKNNENTQNIGYHYLIEGETIYRLIEEKFASRSLLEDKPTYITKSLFGDTVNQQVISIGIIVNEN